MANSIRLDTEGPSILVLTVAGRVTPKDLDDAQALVQRHALTCPWLVIDLTGVDSFGDDLCGLLVRIHTYCRKAGHRAPAVIPSVDLRQLLHIARLDTVLDVQDTLAEAVRSLRAERGNSRSPS